jgi:hypothetical protein
MTPTTTTKALTAVLSGAMSYRKHLVPAPRPRLVRRPYPAALCGTTPARESKGWTLTPIAGPNRSTDKRPLCPRCLAATTPPRPHTTEKRPTPSAPPRRALPPATPAAKVVADASAEAYETRVITAIERTTPPRDTERCAQLVGRDAGGGWIIIRTDGVRALLRKGTSTEKTVRPITEDAPPKAGVTLTPELEVALRTLWRTMDRKRPTVWLEIDGRKRRVVIDPVSSGGSHKVIVPVTGDLKAMRFGVQLRWLLDGFGRGGRLGYLTTKDGARQPLVLDTPDGLRYVLMPIAAPKAAKGAAA